MNTPPRRLTSEASRSGIGFTGRLVDLSGREKRQQYEISREGKERLRQNMKGVAVEINKRLQALNAPPLVQDDGRLDMQPFQVQGLPVSNDQALAKQIKKSYLGLAPDIQNNFLDLRADHNVDFEKKYKRKPKNEAELYDFCVKQEDESLSNTCEMAITVLLHRKLGARYIVVRSSTYDDLTNGVDGFIVDTHTGAKICSIDELTLHDEATRGVGGNKKDDDRNVSKTARQKQIMARGGSRLKYGFDIVRGQNKTNIKIGPVENIPIFIAGIPKDDLVALVNSQQADIKSLPSATENQIFAKLVKSLRDQAKKFLETVQDPALLKNINSFLEAVSERERN